MEERTGRLGQMKIYTGKLFRMFVYEKGWKIIIFAAVISIGVSGIYLFVKGFTLAGSGFPYILLTIGSGITLAGLCLFAWLGARILVIWLVQFTKWLAREIKGIFIKKGEH